MARLLVLHGPNLNLLGQREPGVYGRTTLAEIDADLAAIARESSHDLASFQSNSEGALIDRIHAAGRRRGIEEISFARAKRGRSAHLARDAIGELVGCSMISRVEVVTNGTH